MPVMIPMPQSDVDDLDAVVHALGIEDSNTTPAEAVAELHAEIERLRKIEVRALEWMRFADTEIAIRRADPYLSDTNRLALARPVGEALDRLRAALKEVPHD